MDKQTKKGIENLESTISAEDISVTSKSNGENRDFTEELEKTASETCRAGLDE
jgi:hypothetical protein